MAIWVIISILGSIGLTLFLTGLLYRVNAPPKASSEGRRSDGSSPLLFADGGGRSSRDRDGDDNNGTDGDAGGDGGGGGD